MQTKVFGRRDFIAFYEVIVKIPVRFEAAKLRDGDEVSVNLDTGDIADITTGETFVAAPFPPFIQEIINDGGLVARTKRVMAEKGGN